MPTNVLQESRVGDRIAACGTHRGMVREGNEDACLLDLQSGIAVVVDGVGGQAAGEVAAGMAVQAIRSRLSRRDADPDTRIREAIALANRVIYAESLRSPHLSGMACVLTVAVIEGQQLTIGHVGDSRAYKFNSHGMFKLTHDHSPIGELEDDESISEAEARQHPRRNEVYRDVGSGDREPGDRAFVEIVHSQFEEDAALLLCSDGLSDMVTNQAIHQIVRASAGNAGGVVGALIDAANAAGGADNITAVYVETTRFAGAPFTERVFPPRKRLDAVDTIPFPSATYSEHEVQQSQSQTQRSSMPEWVRSRALVFALGVVLGLGSAIGALTWRGGEGGIRLSRVLVVGGEAPDRYHSVDAALAAARAGDTISLSSGTYRQPIVLDGVSLVAQPFADVVLMGAAGQPAITVRSGRVRVTDLWIEGAPAAPLDAGLRLLGGSVELNNVGFRGALAAALEASGEATADVRAARFEAVEGVPLRVLDSATLLVTNSMFRSEFDAKVAIDLRDKASAQFSYDTFVGFLRPTIPPGRSLTVSSSNVFVPLAAKQ